LNLSPEKEWREKKDATMISKKARIRKAIDAIFDAVSDIPPQITFVPPPPTGTTDSGRRKIEEKKAKLKRFKE
jgi:hypothetical protein